MKYKDYYKILGVSRDASADEIKKAYRKQARKYHPDVSKEKDAEEHFKDVNEANDVLSDPDKRAAYDQLGTSYRSGQEFRPPPDWGTRFRQGDFGHADFGGMDFSDLFSQMFGMGGGPHTTHRGFTGNMRGRDVETTLHLTLEEAFNGVEKTLQLTAPGQTPRTVTVRVPAGALPGKKLRVRGKGEASMHGQSGDLMLHIEVGPHPWFKLDGKNLVLDLPVTPWEAVLGTAVQVPTMTGAVRIRVPAGARSGQKLRLAGKGMPASSGHGDLYAIVQIVVPPETSEAERALYEQLAQTSHFDPRPNFPKD